MSKSRYVKAEGKPIYKIGNKKIGYNTIIFSLSSGHKCCNKNICPYGLDNTCYKIKCENIFESNKLKEGKQLFSDKQGQYFINHTAKQLFLDFLSIIQKYPNIKYIRFNEGGDIKDKQTYLKINKISEMLKPYGIIVYTYTHSNKLFNQLKKEGILKQKSNNFIINGSDNIMIDNTFKVIDKKDTNKYKYICCGNCRECNYCKTGNKKLIAVIKH